MLVQDPDNMPRGPLESHGSTIYQLPSTDFIPNVPLSLKDGEAELHTTADWTNTFVESNSHLNYYETLHLRTSLWFGVDDRLSVGISQPVNIIGGGYLDGFINHFHEAFGIHSNRTNYPSNKFLVTNDSGSFQLPSSVLTGDLMLSFQYKLVNEEHYGLYVGDQIQFPTGDTNEYFQRKHFGVGVFVSGFYDVGNLRWFAASDIAYVGEGEILWEKIRPMQVSALFGADYRLLSWLSLVGQITSVSGSASFDHYTSWASEAEGGFRFRFSNTVFGEFSATEHLIRYDNNADFGIHAGLTVRF
jgi:hypothetical protein